MSTKRGKSQSGARTGPPSIRYAIDARKSTEEDHLYPYDLCYTARKRGWKACPRRSLPADQIERFVVDRVREACLEPEARVSGRRIVFPHR